MVFLYFRTSMFFDMLCRHGLQANNPAFFQQFGPDDGKDFFFELKLTMQLMVAISPILLFLPKKFSSRKFRRDHLIYVSSHSSACSTVLIGRPTDRTSSWQFETEHATRPGEIGIACSPSDFERFQCSARTQGVPC